MLERVLCATEEPAQLLFAANGEPELKEADAAADHHALELGSLAHKLEIFSGRAEAHDVFNPATVIPGAVEENDLTLGGKVLDVALEIPLSALGVGRLGQRDDPCPARIEIFGETLNGATLAGGVAALEEHDDTLSDFLDPGLHLDQLDLEQFNLLEIILFLNHLRIRIGAADDILFALGTFHFLHKVRRDAGAHLFVDQLDHRKGAGQRLTRVLVFLHLLFQPLFLGLLFGLDHLGRR